MSADPPASAPTTPANTYTQGHHPTVLRAHLWRTAANSAAYLLPRLKPGQRILDVGCGPGTISCDLAEIVAAGGAGGYVVGADAGQGAVDTARAEAARRRVGNAWFLRGDACDLPTAASAMAAAGAPDAQVAAARAAAAAAAQAQGLPEGQRSGFDVVHAHQLLLHTPEPLAVLEAMRDAARAPGGVVAVREALAFLHHPPTPLLQRFEQLWRAVMRKGGAEPDAAAMLRKYAREAGLEAGKVRFAMDAGWCFATEEDLHFWCDMWADRLLLSDFKDNAINMGLSTENELRDISNAFRKFPSTPDAWYTVVNASMICET